MVAQRRLWVSPDRHHDNDRVVHSDRKSARAQRGNSRRSSFYQRLDVSVFFFMDRNFSVRAVYCANG